MGVLFMLQRKELIPSKLQAINMTEPFQGDTMAIQRPSILKILLVPMMIILSCTACIQPSDSGDVSQELNDPDQTDTQVEYGLYTSQSSQLPESLGFVFDPKGNPISNATLENGDSSDLNGLLISYGKTYSEQWVVIQSSGFLTGFALAQETLEGAYVFEARLTPLSAVKRFETEEEGSLGSGDLRDPDLEVTFPAGAFDSTPVIAGAAEIDPLDIGPLFESLENGKTLSLQRAFGLGVINGEGEDTQLSSEKTLGIAIRDNGELAEPITMASFDPSQGLWQILPGPCSRRDDAHIYCEVDRISPLIGLFTEQEYLWMPDLSDLQTNSSGQSGLLAPTFNPLANHLFQSGGCDGPMGEALNQELLSYRVIIGDMINSEADLSSDTMADLMNDYAAAAFQYADLCKNEKGKGALLKVLGVELTLGLQFGDNWGWDPTRVTDKISELTIDRVKEELTEGKCLDMKEALGAYKEALLFGEENTQLPGEDETIKEAFDRKMEEWSSECDLWTGTITITHYPAGSHFGLEEWTTLNSNNTWTEKHDLRIATHPDTHAVTGRSNVTLNFPAVLYSKVGSDDPCDVNSFQSYYGFPSDEMNISGDQGDFENPAEPGDQSAADLQALFEKYKENPEDLTPEEMSALGDLLSDLSDPDAVEEILSGSSDSTDPGPLEYGFDITFSGTYDGSAFSISDLQYNCYAEIIQYIYNEGEEDDECVVHFEASIPVHNYSSYLAHGFYGSPPITLQEILETAPGTAGGMEVIRGSGKFGNPSPDVGSYPFNTSSVTWNLVHVQDQGIK